MIGARAVLRGARDAMSTTTELSTMLTAVETAISTLLTSGQEYRIGNRMYRRADLEQLRAWRRELQAELAIGTHGSSITYAKFEEPS